MTITVEYVLASPEFKPQRAVDRAAGLDIKAYLLDGRTKTKPFDAVYTDYSNLKYINTSENDDYKNTQIYVDGVLAGELTIHEISIENKSEYADKNYLFLAPGRQVVVNAGFKVGLATNFKNRIATMLVCPRSGLAAKHGITVTNAPGVVDEHYPDWVGVILINHGKDLHLFSHGSKIAQVMYLETCVEQDSIVKELTTKGERKGGFGSTGI